MKFNLKGLLTIAAAASALILSGCGEKEADNHTIKVGVIAGAEEQVAEVAAKVAKEKYGLEVKLVTFTDYVTPNAALADGSIDLNAFQHKPFLDQQVEERGYKLTVAGNTLVYPIAGYSKKIKSVDELKDGDKISIPNDPTNLGRALLLLEDQGLIKLRENAGLQATVRDVIENPKHLDIIELEAPQLPRSLDDVAISIVNTTYIGSVNMTPQKDGLFVEGKDSPYVNIMAAREENVNDENVQNFVKAYQTDEVFNAATEIFQGGVVKGW